MQVFFCIFVFTFLGGAFAAPREKRFGFPFFQYVGGPFGYAGEGAFAGARPWLDTDYYPHSGFPSYFPFDTLFNWPTFKPYNPWYYGPFGGFGPFGFASMGAGPFGGFPPNFPFNQPFNWIPFKLPTPWYEGPNVCTDRKIVKDSDYVQAWFNSGSPSVGHMGQQSSVCHGDNNLYTCIQSVSTNEGAKKIYTKYFCCYGFTRFADGRPGCVESGVPILH